MAAGGLLAASLAGLAPVAVAAPADAGATALRVALNAAVGTTPVITLIGANATVASVTAPPDSSVNAVSVAAALGGSTGVTVQGGVASASATSSQTQSQGRSQVTGLALSILGSSTTATVLSGEATCPAGGQPVAKTVVTNLSVLGQAVNATVNGAPVTVTTALTVPGLANATLSAVVQTRIEQTTATTATATALRITFTLTATTLGGVAVTIPVGTLEAGNATCTSPLVAAAPTVTGLAPTSGPTAGNTTVTVTGTGFVAGSTTVTIGGTTIPADQVTVTSPTTLTFVTPAHPAGPVDVTVTTPTGTSGPQTYTYTSSGPQPPQPPMNGGPRVPGSGAPDTGDGGNVNPLNWLVALGLLTGGAGVAMGARRQRWNA